MEIRINGNLPRQKEDLFTTGTKIIASDPLDSQCPWGKEAKMVSDYTPYQQRIRESFAAAYRFLDEHKHPRTAEDWHKIVQDTEPYTDPLTIGLIAACLKELEREYQENMERTD